MPGVIRTENATAKRQKCQIFKQMNSCAVSLVDETARREYVKRALAVFERELLGWLL